MTGRILLITNARSGSADEEVDLAAEFRDHGARVDEVDIADVTGHAPDPSTTRVIVAGGDGSIAPAAQVAADLDVPLGVVPAGTANDFARALQLPDDMADALALAADGRRLRPIELGLLDGRPFVNVVSLGIAPHAAAAAASLKSRLGPFAYPVGALLGMARAKPVELVATVDGSPAFTGTAWQVMIASTGAFGGWGDTGGTTLGDGKLDLVIVPSGRAARRLMFDAAALLNGDLARREGVHHARGVEIALECSASPDVVLDGEELSLQVRRLHARVHARLVQVVVA